MKLEYMLANKYCHICRPRIRILIKCTYTYYTLYYISSLSVSRTIVRKNNPLYLQHPSHAEFGDWEKSDEFGPASLYGRFRFIYIIV